MLAFFRAGDIVVVHSMDRLAHNLDDLRCIVQTLSGKGVRVEFVKDDLTFIGEDSPMATLLLSVVGAFAEYERALILDLIYTQQSMLSDKQAQQLRERVAARERKSALAKEFGINRATVYSYPRTSSNQHAGSRPAATAGHPRTRI